MTKRKAEWQNNYIAKTYDRVNLTLPKGKKAELQDYATARNESLNGFINRAIDEAINRDNNYVPIDEHSITVPVQQNDNINHSFDDIQPTKTFTFQYCQFDVGRLFGMLRSKRGNSKLQNITGESLLYYVENGTLPDEYRNQTFDGAAMKASLKGWSSADKFDLEWLLQFMIPTN